MGAMASAAGRQNNATNELYCWGDNTFGQLGIGILGFSTGPFAVALP